MYAIYLMSQQLCQTVSFPAESMSSDSSSFTFCHLTSPHDDSGGSSVVVETFSTIKHDNSTPWRKRNIRIEDDAKQQSHPLPLPPGATPRGQEIRDENVWKKGTLIYRGILGGVYRGFNSEKGRMCAIKEIPFTCDGDERQAARVLEKEIALLSSMKHPNIVQYYGSKSVSDKFYIYYEYMSRGSIHMILQQYGRLGESAIRSYTRDILSGLAYLHSRNIAHGDIKGAHTLVDPNGRVKLSNFSIEKQIAEKFRMCWMMESPYWMAPEVVMNPSARNLAADIWSIGCTVLEMASAKPPLSQYDGVTAMMKVAYEKEIPRIPDEVSAVCKNFLRHCLRWNPLHRATASQLLEHPFVKGHSFNI